MPTLPLESQKHLLTNSYFAFSQSIIKSLNKKCYYVGGFVRDILLNNFDFNDIDLEVFGYTENDILTLAFPLSLLHPGLEVTKIGLGVFEFRNSEHVLQVSLPREEVSTGPGHNDFNIILSPNIEIEKACRRRDFTINALYMDKDFNIYDYVDGISDLEKKTIRATSSQIIVEDPLRILRAVQLASRLNFTIAGQTKETIKANVKLLKHLSKERFQWEWFKLLTKSPEPSYGLHLLNHLGILKEVWPELEVLQTIKQDPKYHPEGSVWNHTLNIVDLIASFSNDPDKKFMFCLAGLLHDIGKATTTVIDPDTGKISSIGHESEGVPIASRFLDSIGIVEGSNLSKQILELVAMHMRPLDLHKCSTRAPFFRLFRALQHNTPLDLLFFHCCDKCARGSYVVSNYEPNLYANVGVFKSTYTSYYQQYKDYVKVSPNIITGKDLIEAGYTPGPTFKTIISLCNELGDHGYTYDQLMELINVKCIQIPYTLISVLKSILEEPTDAQPA